MKTYNDFRSEKSWWRKILIKLGLKLLRTAGTKPLKKETKDEAVGRRTSYLVELIEAGYSVEKKTEYHYRINGILDIYPTNARWHDLKSQERGGFEGKNVATFVRRYLGEINI